MTERTPLDPETQRLLTEIERGYQQVARALFQLRHHLEGTSLAEELLGPAGPTVQGDDQHGQLAADWPGPPVDREQLDREDEDWDLLGPDDPRPIG